jgi:hypothetical protein
MLDIMQRFNMKLTILTITPRGKVVSMVSCGQFFEIPNCSSEFVELVKPVNWSANQTTP